MEFLRPSRHRTLLSETVYIVLNILVALVIFMVVHTVGSLPAAITLVFLSKWRVIAVRPQYWYANLISNLVDIIVGVSYVVALYVVSNELYVQIGLVVLYIVWLLLIKPRSKKIWVLLQSAIGLFSGVSALMYVSSDWWSSMVVIAMWIIGYATARHVFTAYKEVHYGLLSLIWALVVAEIGWICYHWNFAYSFGDSNLKLSQAALISVLIGLIVERGYAAIHAHKTLKSSDVVVPTVLTIGFLVVLITIFGKVGTI